LGKYVFRTCPSDALAGEAAAEYAFNKLKSRTAGVIYQNKEYPQALKQVFVNNFALLGGKIIFEEIFETGTTDFSSIAEKAKINSVDVIYLLPQSPTPGFMLIKSLKETGVQSQLLTADAMMVRETFQEQGEILEGLIGLEAIFDANQPKTKHFIESFKSTYHLEPAYPSYMAGAYDIIYLLKTVMENSPDDADSQAQYLYDLQDWEGAVGHLNFNSNGDPTIPYNVIKVSNYSGNPIDTIIPTHK
jgi:branched-chain amino acid transport system substrate-binding protein